MGSSHSPVRWLWGHVRSWHPLLVIETMEAMKVAVHLALQSCSMEIRGWCMLGNMWAWQAASSRLPSWSVVVMVEVIIALLGRRT